MKQEKAPERRITTHWPSGAEKDWKKWTRDLLGEKSAALLDSISDNARNHFGEALFNGSTITQEVYAFIEDALRKNGIESSSKGVDDYRFHVLRYLIAEECLGNTKKASVGKIETKTSPPTSNHTSSRIRGGGIDRGLPNGDR